LNVARNKPIKPDTQNYRLHPEASKNLIRKSLKEVGAGRSILLDKDNNILAGNGVYEQAQALGLKIKIVTTDENTLVAVRRPDLTGRKATRAALYDNRTQELSAWDTGTLSTLGRNDAAMLEGIFEAEKAQITALDAQTEPTVALRDPEAILDALETKWKPKQGDLFVIPSGTVPGQNHYVYCGDCREFDLAARLGVKVNGVFTSPPYAEQRAKRYGGIQTEKYVEWWKDVQESVREWLECGGSFFVNIKPHCETGQRVLYVNDLVSAMVREWGWNFVEEYCWRKHKMPGLDKFRFRNAFEPIYQFSLDGRPNIYHHQVATIGTSSIFKDTQADVKFDGSSIFDGNIEGIQGEVLPDNVIEAWGAKGIHAATFPEKLVNFFVQAFSKPGEYWADPFAGSGTVLVSCEKLGRLGVGVELLPRYTALILENMSELGLMPTKAK
jgi:site-specific DNA-methyltransferase (adenine-specific)